MPCRAQQTMKEQVKISFFHIKGGCEEKGKVLWTLCQDLQNGVSIASTITDKSDRKLLHKIGQQYGLIPLCPNETVGLEFLEDGQIKFAVVETIFGRLKINPHKPEG